LLQPKGVDLIVNPAQIWRDKANAVSGGNNIRHSVFNSLGSDLELPLQLDLLPILRLRIRMEAE
jgi:hypothetical protein